MKKKLIFTIIIFLIVMAGAIFAVFLKNRENKNEISNISKISEKVTDKCTEEYENESVEQVSSREEKISPNCEMVIKKYFKTCGHTTNVYVELPQELVNMTKEELKQKYSDWDVEEFSSNKIILYKVINSTCGEHYEIKSADNKVIVYKLLDDDSKVIYEITGISLEYLTQEDRDKLAIGIQVNGTEKLNETLEDFE